MTNHRRLTIAALGVFLSTLVSVSNAHAILLSDAFLAGGSSSSGPFSGLGFGLRYNDDPLTTLIDTSTLFGVGNSGDIITFQSGDTGFDEFVSYLTDGVDQQIFRRTQIPGRVTSTSRPLESQLFPSLANPVPSLNGIDYQGFSISSIQITINSLIAPLSQDGGYSYQASWQIYGESQTAVPEPTGILLLGAGLLGSLRMRKNRS